MCFDSTRVDDKTNAPRLYLTHGLRRTRRQFRTTGRRIRIHLLHDARFRAGSSGGRATTFVAHLLLQFFSKAPPTERRRKTNLLLLLPLLVTLDGCVARATRATRLSLYRKKESRAMRVRVRSVLMRAQKRKALRGKFIMTLRKRLVVLSNVYKKNDEKREKIQNFHTLNSPLPFFFFFFLLTFVETPNFQSSSICQTNTSKNFTKKKKKKKNAHEMKT